MRRRQGRRSQLTLNSAASSAQHEAITALSDGSYVVTWTDGTTVFGEHFSASGSAIGSQFSVGRTVSGGASSVTALSGGGFLITWAGADTKVHGQQFDATGSPSRRGLEQTSNSTGNSHPVLATLANGDVVLAWTGSDGSGTGIAGQFFSGAQTQSSADSYRPVISPDGRYIIFASDAALVPGDTNGQTDTYIYDRWTQSVSLVSQTAAGQLGFNIESLGNGVSSGGSISAFGGAALAFNQGTASKAGSVITFANSSLSDFNPDAGTITLTLHVDHGALHAVSSGGLTIDPLQNGSNGTLVVTGSLTDINAALHAGVTYTPASGFASSTDTLTLQAVDTTGDGTTQVVSFDNSHSNSVTNQPDSIITNVDNSFITNVYAVDSSTGGAGAVLDDARALTYLPAQAAGIAHADVDANPLTQTPGFVFAVPGQQGVLQSADFNVFSTGAAGQAHIFKLALYEWNGSNAVGPAIFTTGPFNLQDPTNTPITDFPLNGLNIPVDPTKQYVWEIVADGTVTTSTPATLNFAPALTTSGALGFVDSNDTHTVSVASQAGDWGHLTAWVSTDTTGTNQDGTINWAYEVDPKTAAALAIGQTHTDTFAVTLIDSGGNAVSRNVTVTVLGTNEAAAADFCFVRGVVRRDDTVRSHQHEFGRGKSRRRLHRRPGRRPTTQCAQREWQFHLHRFQRGRRRRHRQPQRHRRAGIERVEIGGRRRAQLRYAAERRPAPVGRAVRRDRRHEQPFGHLRRLAQSRSDQRHAGRGRLALPAARQRARFPGGRRDADARL